MRISGDYLTYMDGRYIGDLSLAYRGTYDPTKTTANYNSTGAGTFTLDPLAFRGGVYGQLEYYRESNGVGSFNQGDWVDVGLLGGTGDLFSGSPTRARVLGKYSPEEACSEPSLLYSFGPSLSGSTGQLTVANTGDDGSFLGHLAGVWNDGSLASAKALALAVKPAGNGYEAGVGGGHDSLILP